MFFCSHLNDKSEKMHLAQVHTELNIPRSFVFIETDNECTRTILSRRPGQGTTEGSPAPVWTKSYLVSWELGAVLRLISITWSLRVTCPYIRMQCRKENLEQVKTQVASTLRIARYVNPLNPPEPRWKGVTCTRGQPPLLLRANTVFTSWSSQEHWQYEESGSGFQNNKWP